MGLRAVFPVFFATKVEMSPMGVCAVMVAATAFLAWFTFVARRVSLVIGRLQTALLVRVLGVALLVTLGVLRSCWTKWWIMAPIYVLRTALMNCAGALTQSVLMDFTDKKERARWAALQAITQFGWSGSAMVGGVLLDKYGFGPTFFVTAAMQLGGASLLLLLFGIDTAENDSHQKKNRRKGATSEALLSVVEDQVHGDKEAAVT